MQDIRFDGEVSAHGECSADFDYSFPVGRIDHSAVIDCLECEVVNCKIICNRNHIPGILSLSRSVPDAFDLGCRITFAGHCDIAEAQNTRCKCNGCILNGDGCFYTEALECESVINQSVCLNIERAAIVETETIGPCIISDIAVASQSDGSIVDFNISGVVKMASIFQCKFGISIQIQIIVCHDINCRRTGSCGEDFSAVDKQIGVDKQIRIVRHRNFSRENRSSHAVDPYLGIFACSLNCSGNSGTERGCIQIQSAAESGVHIIGRIGNENLFSGFQEISFCRRVKVNPCACHNAEVVIAFSKIGAAEVGRHEILLAAVNGQAFAFRNGQDRIRMAVS